MYFSACLDIPTEVYVLNHSKYAIKENSFNSHRVICYRFTYHSIIQLNKILNESESLLRCFSPPRLFQSTRLLDLKNNLQIYSNFLFYSSVQDPRVSHPTFQNIIQNRLSSWSYWRFIIINKELYHIIQTTTLEDYQQQ